MPNHPHPAVLDRLVRALNGHDLEAMATCFAEDYVNRTPAHPARSFVGRDQVRRNWSQIFAGVPDVHAVLMRTLVDGQNVWSEWELAGTRTDGTRFLMRGVVIFQIAADTITAATFYLEPVEHAGGRADEAARRAAVGPAHT